MNATVVTVMAYEIPAVAKLVRERRGVMVKILNHNCDFELGMWKFVLLRIPEHRETAVRDAAKAEMIFVVTRGGGEFVTGVKAWIEEWLARKSQESPMRLLLQVRDPAAGNIARPAFSPSEYLPHAACRGAMDFLSSDITIPNRQGAIPGSVPAF